MTNTNTVKTFTVVGVARNRADLPLKLRCANGTAKKRTAKMAYHGILDIVLFDMPAALTRAEAADWLRTNHADVFATLPVTAVTEETTEVEPVVEEVVEEVVVEFEPVVEEVVVTVVLTKEEKLLRKRAHDAAVKRAKRAAARVEREAAKAALVA